MKLLITETLGVFDDVMYYLKALWECYDSTDDVPDGNLNEYFQLARSYMALLSKNDQHIDEDPSTLGYADYYY